MTQENVHDDGDPVSEEVMMEEDDDLILPIPPLPPRWAKGSRDTFLQSLLDGYRTAHRVLVTRAREYVDNVLTMYYAVYHWSLKYNQEPLPENPRRDPNECLMPRQAEYKAAHIVMMRSSLFWWFNYRASAFREGAKAEAAIGDLLEEVCGPQKKTRARSLTAPQLWSKEHWDEHREDFDGWFDEQDLPEHTRSAERGKYTIRLFLALPKNERQVYEERAVKQRESKKKQRKGKGKGVDPLSDEEGDEDAAGDVVDVVNAAASSVIIAGESSTPEGRLALQDLQIAWENVEAIAYPFIEALGRKLNMRISCFIGGPVPGDGGRINATSVHYRTNHEPVPREWPHALGGRSYKPAMKNFVEFLQGCYMPEEQRQQALPNSLESQPEEEDKDVLGEDESAVEDEPKKKRKKGKGLDGEGRPSKHQHRKGGSRKKDKRSELEAPPARSTSPRPPIPPPPAPPTPPAPPQPSPAPWSSPACSRRPSELPGSLEGMVPDELIDPRLRGLPHPEVPRHLWDVIITSGPNDIAPLPAPSPSKVVGQASPKPHESGQSANEMEEPAVKMGPATNFEEISWLREEDKLLLEEGKWEGWFKVTWKYLAEYDLGDKWDSMLHCWTVLEGRRGFEDLKGGKHALPKVGRPVLIEAWIKSARRPHPELKADDVPFFAEDWWLWWKGIQLDWRDVEGVRGPLEARHQTGTGDWSVLDKPGQNRLLSVLAGLAWWGETVYESETAVVDKWWREEWDCAMDNVHYVMIAMLNWMS